ncbi:MAG: hypothetical protein A2031_08735 [Deltaproteobacteria bacterium RBG_19FT_COMBO_43_11]|nr:MAG: hypothetical protein A2031_08735 [Deltaproteobacteria bacterium RBG_19FT_COMBO_43_11]
MATQTQLGMTINARNLELMLRRLAALSLAEAQEYSKKLYTATKDIAPSLIRYTQATDYDKLTKQNLTKRADAYFIKSSIKTSSKNSAATRLTYASPDADNKIAAALLFSSSGVNYAQCLKQAKRLTSTQRRAFFKTAFEHLQQHDSVLRELENIDLQFELAPSASCFAQLKRHRMSTIIAQEYNPSLGVTVPPSVRKIGQQKIFMEIMRQTEKAYEQIKKKVPSAASYVLTNAHRKRVLMKFNAREMYHLARLRADAHAQWDIRKLTEDMLRQAKKVMPLALSLACGKDSFAALYKKTFRR